MHYPIAIHKDDDSDYGVSVPDLPGCISAGETFEDAIAMAREAIELHLEGIIEDGGVPPQPTPIEQWQSDREYDGAVWAVVLIKESSLSLKAQRVQITLPERLLAAVDAFADREGDTRSGLLARAAWAYMGRDPAKTPKGRQGRTLLGSSARKPGVTIKRKAKAKSVKTTKASKQTTSKGRKTTRRAK